MTTLRRSTLFARALWLATRTASVVSPVLAGRGATLLWFVPWQRTAPADTVWPPTTRHHRIVAAGHVVDVHEFGAGPTVLLVHGWSDHAGSLLPLAEALAAAGRRVVAVDLPAHGDTPGLRTDVRNQAAVVHDLLTRYDVGAVVAHSLGSAATALALRTGPSAVQRAVLIAPAVRLESAVQRFLVELQLPAALEPELRRRIERLFGADVWTDVATDHNLAASGVSGLVIHDEDDRRAPIAEARQLVASWPGAELEVTRGLGHVRLLADPGVVARVVDAVTADDRASSETASTSAPGRRWP